jgi:hypothetical protein
MFIASGDFDRKCDEEKPRGIGNIYTLAEICFHCLARFARGCWLLELYQSLLVYVTFLLGRRIVFWPLLDDSGSKRNALAGSLSPVRAGVPIG